jgi:peptidoglycan/xylan/chitin deacetylase (PgdA/CDA1 family)
MAKPTSVCYRHPEQSAKRKCFQCKKPVCPACQVQLDHHIFCGEECYQAWLAKPAKPKNRPAPRRKKPPAPALPPVPEPVAAEPKPADPGPDAKIGPLIQEEIQRLAWSVEVLRGQLEGLERDQKKTDQKLRDQEQQNRAHRRTSLIPFLIVGLLLSGTYFVRAMIMPSKSASPAKVPAPSSYDVEYPASLADDPGAGGAPDLELPAAGRKLENNRITLFGAAPGAVSVRLLQNGEVAAGAAVDQGEFSFPNIALGPGLNAFQIEATDAKGRKSYSLARFLDRISRAVARVPALQGLNFMRGPRERSELVLSFDAGSSDRQAEAVLDVLKAERITTTVFLTGQFIERYPDLVRRIVADGHEVGNHTYSHPHLTTYEQNGRQGTRSSVDREFLQNELKRTAALFEKVTGRPMTGWWRAPYGEHNGEIRHWAEEAGFKHVDWTHGPDGKNYDMLDWVADARSRHYLKAEQLHRRLVGLDNGRPGAANGGIILMHLGTDRQQDFPAAILPQAIEALRAKGYRFVTVTELFRD